NCAPVFALDYAYLEADGALRGAPGCFSWPFCFVGTMWRRDLLASKTPIKNIVQPKVIISQKIFFTPRRAVVPARALTRSHARISTFAHSKWLVPWRSFSFQPE